MKPIRNVQLQRPIAVNRVFVDCIILEMNPGSDEHHWVASALKGA